MTAPPPGSDPVDIAAAFPGPTARRAGYVRHSEVADRSAAPDPALVGRLDATEPGPSEVVLSAERLTATTEWTQVGAVRFRRRITTRTSTVEVTVRREELQVEVRDVSERDGAWVGTEYRGPAVPAPPVTTGPGVFVLREEVPDVSVRVVPYERVVVDINRVTAQVHLTDIARREQAAVSGDTGTVHPPQRT